MNSLSPAAAKLEVGDVMPSARFGPITRTDIVRYAGAGGDFNPIHFDEQFAHAAGQPSVFSMGLLQGGVLAHHLARWVGVDKLTRLKLRFRAQVWPGDVLLMEARVVGRDGSRAQIEVTVTRGVSDEVVLSGVAEVDAFRADPASHD